MRNLCHEIPRDQSRIANMGDWAKHNAGIIDVPNFTQIT
jgi:hypothetical protein